MSLYQEGEIQSSVYICTFECFIRQANIAMKFPCSYFVNWSTTNGKFIANTTRHTPQQNIVVFDQSLSLTTELLYDHNKLEYIKKQTLIELFLISKSRPDQNKLVGRVTVDIAKVINVGMYAEPTQFRLNFCSVEGSIIMNFTPIEQKLTSMGIQDLDRSSFIDYISQTALKAQPRNLSQIRQSQNLSTEKDLRNKSPKASSEIRLSSPTSVGDKFGIFSNKIDKIKPKIESGLIRTTSQQDPSKINKINDSSKLDLKMMQSFTMKKDQKSKQQQIEQKPVYEKSQIRSNRWKESYLNGDRQIKNNQQITKTDNKNKNILEESKPIQIFTDSKIQQKNQINEESRAIKYFKANRGKQQPQKLNQILLAQSAKSDQFMIRDSNRHVIQSASILHRQASSELKMDQSKIKPIRDEVQIFKQKLGQYEQLLEVAKLQKNKLIDEKQERQQIIDEFSAREQHFKQENDRIFQNLQQKNNVIADLDSELNQKDQIIQQLNAQIIQMNQQIESLTSFKTRSSELNQKIKYLQSKNQQLTKIMQQKQTTAQSYISKCEKMEVFINNISAENQKYQQQGDIQNQTIKNIQQKLQQLAKQNNKFKEVIAELNAALSNNHSDAHLQKQLQYIKTIQEKQLLILGLKEDFNKQLQTILIQKQQKQQQYQHILSEKDRANQQICKQYKDQNIKIKEQLNTKNNQIEGFRVAQQQTRHRYQNTLQQLQQIQLKFLEQEERQNSHKEGKQINSQNNSAQQSPQRFNFEEDYRQLVEQNSRLNQQIQFLRSNMEMLQSQNINIDMSSKQIIKGLQLKLIQLNKKLEQSTKLQNKAGSILNQKTNEMITQIDALNKEVKCLRNKNDEANLLSQQNIKLSTQANALKTKISQLEKQKEILKEQNQKQKLIKIQKQSESSIQDKQNWKERCQQNQMMIGQLNCNLEEQINQNNQLSEAIIRYMEKQAKMKETLTILEQESKQIFSLVQEKQQNQQMYQRMIGQLQTEVQQLREMLNETPKKVQKVQSNKKIEAFAQLQIEKNTIPNQQLQQMKHQLKKVNSQLESKNSHLQQLNDQLNQQITILTQHHNENKYKLEDQIKQLTLHINDLTSVKTKNQDLLSSKSKQYQKNIKGKEVQLEVWKSRYSQKQSQRFSLEKEISKIKKYTEELEEEMFGLESATNQKDIKIQDLEEINQVLFRQMEELKNIQTPNSTIPNSDNQLSIANALIELKQKLLQKTISSDNLESFFQNILDKSIMGEEAGKILNLQQKSRLLSKQLQKLKSQLLKSEWRNNPQKLNFFNLFKKCELIVTELIAVIESLNVNQSSFL